MIRLAGTGWTILNKALLPSPEGVDRVAPELDLIVTKAVLLATHFGPLDLLVTRRDEVEQCFVLLDAPACVDDRSDQKRSEAAQSCGGMHPT